MLPETLSFSVPDLFGNEEISITFHEGINTFVGPNGSGKSKTLRALKNRVGRVEGVQNTLLLPAGRLKPMEEKRVIDHPNINNPDDRGNVSITLDQDYLDRWENVETVKGIFNRLSERIDIQIKLAERLRSLFDREILLDWDRGNLRLRFSRGEEEYSGERESSGLLHLVGILAALYDDELDAVLIDEPDISLHPQLQSFLLREIQAAAGNPADGEKIIVMATHSPSMVKIEKVSDLPKFVFFNDSDILPQEVDAGAGILDSARLSSLAQSLRTSHKEALFAQRPLLVEGPSDETILSALDTALQNYLEAAGGYILPVGGTGEISAAVALLRLTGKKPAVLADLDAFTDDLDLINEFNQFESGRQAANEAGHDNLHDAANGAHQRLSSAVQNHWDEIRAEATSHSYWTSAEGEGSGKFERKRRAVAAVLLTREEETIESLPNGEDVWLPLRRQLVATLDIAENAGCFFLRSGEIEDTYADDVNREDKTEEARNEAEEIRNDPPAAENRHAVAIRAIRHVAQAPEIDESKAVQEAFVAVVGPILRKLRDDHEAETEKLRSAASRHADESAQLFEIQRVENRNGAPRVRVDLNNSVLDVDGFPVTVRADDDVNTVASRTINPSGGS